MEILEFFSLILILNLSSYDNIKSRISIRLSEIHVLIKQFFLIKQLETLISFLNMRTSFCVWLSCIYPGEGKQAINCFHAIILNFSMNGQLRKFENRASTVQYTIREYNLIKLRRLITVMTNAQRYGRCSRQRNNQNYRLHTNCELDTYLLLLTPFPPTLQRLIIELASGLRTDGRPRRKYHSRFT